MQLILHYSFYLRMLPRNFCSRNHNYSRKTFSGGIILEFGIRYMLSLMSSIIWDSISNLTSPSYYIFISTSAKQFQYYIDIIIILRVDHQRVIIRMGDDVERLNALTEAAAEGKTNDVIKLLEDGIPINGRDGNSKTALYRACCQGKSQTVRELLKRGADCNITSKEELTPLYIGRSKA